MNPTAKHGILLVGGGLAALLSLAIPWISGGPILGYASALLINTAFESVPINWGGPTSLLVITSIFYVLMIASPMFLIAVGAVQYLETSAAVVLVRRVGYVLYAIAILCGGVFVFTAPELAELGPGYFVFVGVFAILIAAEVAFASPKPRVATASPE